MLLFLTYEFRYEFMYMTNIVKSYLEACVPRFQMPSHFVTVGLPMSRSRA